MLCEIVQLNYVYTSKCPKDRPVHALYLQPLKKPTADCWYSTIPIGHAALAGTVSKMCRLAGISGYKTNHSLRATAATRLYQAGIDEQLIMRQLVITTWKVFIAINTLTGSSKKMYQTFCSLTKKQAMHTTHYPHQSS